MATRKAVRFHGYGAPDVLGRGGVGLIACQWAKRLGARVIGIVGNADKAAIARGNSCDHAIVRAYE